MIPMNKWRIAGAVQELNEMLVNSLELATVSNGEEISKDMCIEMAFDIAQGSRLDAAAIADLAAFIYVRAGSLKQAGLV